MHTAHRSKRETKKSKAENRGGQVCLSAPSDMSAELKRKKGYTTVLLRLSTGTQTRGRASHHNGLRVRFVPERATPERLTASLQALETTCAD